MITYGDFSASKSGVLTQPSVLSDGNTFAWYNKGAVTKDESGIITAWQDLLGSDNSLVPLSGVTALATSDGVVTDATQAGLSTGVKIYNQPLVYYIVFEILTPVATKPLISGPSGFTSTSLYIHNTDGRISLYSGNLVPAVTVGTAKSIITACFNGASSFIRLNNAAKIIGDAGSNNAGGLRIGENVNTRYVDIIARKIIDTDANDTKILNYLKLLNNMSF